MRISSWVAGCVCVLAGTPGDAFAQTSTSSTAERGVDLETIVVTGVAGLRRSQLKSSVSVSDLSLDEIKDFAPRTTAEIFRNIPGIRSESSGGENNANINVRGIPVTTGGAKYVQLQEDGLPVLAFGDITFGNADNFLRFDTTVRRIEAIRGGSASTFTSNGPGAIINLISRTGDVEGGEVGLTRGLDFDTTRVDFQYGSPFLDNWTFHVGGFFRTGEGVREAGYNAEEGGQLKANLTRKFDSGHVRLYFKHLNDRVIPYLPAPMRVSGSTVEPVAGFDFRNQTLSSRYLLNNVRVDSNGQIGNVSVADGVRSITNAIGLEAEFDLGADWKISNRGRYSANSGGFVGTFANGIVNLDSAASTYGGTSLQYHNGPRAGQDVTAATAGSDMLIDNLLFDVAVNDLSHFVNDLRLSKKIETGIGDFDVAVGYYKSIQQVATEWSFNNYLQELRGDNAALINVVDANGNFTTNGGITQFGIFDPFFDLAFNRDAVYGSLAYSVGRFSFDASVRYEIMNGSGSSSQAPTSDPTSGGTTRYNSDDNGDGLVDGAEVDLDINGDGRINLAEQGGINGGTGLRDGIPVVDQGDLFAVDYTVDYVSYSLGANYEFIDGFAAFARFSQGASTNGDRLLLGAAAFTGSGDLVDDDSAVDIVQQAELGLKFQKKGAFGNVAVFLTGFFASTDESNFDVTTGRAVDRTVQAFGAELEASYRYGPFYLVGGVTGTQAEITRDSLNEALEGNTPQRQAPLIYQVTTGWADFAWDRFYSVGFNVVGTLDSPASDANNWDMPGFHQVNVFANIELFPQVLLSFNANNLFNTFGMTEVQESDLPDNGIVRGRPINGRSMSLSLRYQF